MPPKRNSRLGKVMEGKDYSNFNVILPKEVKLKAVQDADAHEMTAGEYVQFCMKVRAESVFLPPDIVDWLDGMAEREGRTRDEICTRLLQARRNNPLGSHFQV